MKVLSLKKKEIVSYLSKLSQKRKLDKSKSIDKKVFNIINEVKRNGDKAIIRFSQKFDNKKITKNHLLIKKNEITNYKKLVDKKILDSFKIAIKNITDFHSKQYPKSYIKSNKGIKTSLKWKAINSVGLYVPGGHAIYPSSLIMNVVPARVAKVNRIVLCTPPVNNSFNPYFMALIDLLKIDEVYQIGGAQAIAAMAYGTESIKSVNKIFGPGNSYVASAKKQVFGDVGIDLIAGPSEIVIVADKFSNPAWVASDLLAQAEHDIKAQCILITDNKQLAYEVSNQVKKLSRKLKSFNIISQSINNFGLILIVNKLDMASSIINYIAPEHLHLQNRNYKKILKEVNNCGSVFIGKYSSEVFGDYIAGPNHILPTYGSSKFSSGLGVLDFMKRTTYTEMNKKSFNKYAKYAKNIAEVENLDAHKFSISIRQNEKK
ncbi:MAG: Histidinol dehydrogenase [Alphaproteobacteria bacterium MarineAlpha5_Bin9]|mgnify:CR=1 FL=1|nr:MAG: Histidinol dehydrogenase [Alphaproteobacteria bacterium MarineAlpha5_Bin9]|tara:strand:+ start:2346 stop:3641 length:1296 start_codon:yes stop_codon:yes gene_type:complete